MAKHEVIHFSDTLPAEKRTIRNSILRELLLELDKNKIDPRGIEITGARLTGDLDLVDVTLPVGLHLIRCELTGSLCLQGAQLIRLILRGSRIRGLRADGVQVQKGINAQDVHCDGAFRLIGSTIEGQLNLTGATITGDGHSGLLADGMRVGGDALLRQAPSGRPFVARGDKDGAVRLLAAEIGGNLDCERAVFSSAQATAFDGERARVGGNIILRSIRSRGDVILQRASVRGQLNCKNAELGGLVADGLQTDDDVILSGLRAGRAGPDATVSLIGARVGGHLICDKGEVAGPGLSLDLRFVSVGKALSLRPDFFAARNGGTVVLDGLTYPAIPHGMERDEWLAFLRHRTEGHAAQPYQQLATAYRSAGREDDARVVLIAQQDHRSADPRLARRTRLRLRLLRLTLGYGYQSWRALIGLLLNLALAVVVVLGAANWSAAVHKPATENSRPTPCLFVYRVGLGVDLALPLIKTGSRHRCDLAATKWSEEWIVAVGWVFQILGWALATLFVAGYTGLVRKD
ncbi:hypothetical protein [Actinoallomurus sp. NPDC050550]|uniref:hypothetical protein n=1 Tax=Actinoallomurus sp. NPDC050550 TaxID=3154937 RepID=UPI0033E89F18